MNYKTQSQKTPHETLKFQEKSLLLLQTNDVQVMLLQTQRVSEMSFSAIWKPKLQKLSLWCPTMGASYRELFKQTVKKLNLWWKTAVDKSGWIRAWIGSVILSLDIFLYIFCTQIWSYEHFILVLDSIKQKKRPRPATLFKESLAQVFPCEFCESSKNTFFYRTPPVAASQWRLLEREG